LSVASSTSLRTGLRDKFCCFPNWTNHQTRWASLGIGLIFWSSLTKPLINGLSFVFAKESLVSRAVSPIYKI
jgi:hypothetical protein